MRFDPRLLIEKGNAHHNVGASCENHYDGFVRHRLHTVTSTSRLEARVARRTRRDEVLVEHDSILRDVITRHRGHFDKHTCNHTSPRYVERDWDVGLYLLCELHDTLPVSVIKARRRTKVSAVQRSE
jgi:hypothetical protein